MAGLAHGVATVSNAGALTEPIWARTGCVALAPGPDPAAIVREAEAPAGRPEATGAARRGGAGRYIERSFALERTDRGDARRPDPRMRRTAPCRGSCSSAGDFVKTGGMDRANYAAGVATWPSAATTSTSWRTGPTSRSVRRPNVTLPPGAGSRWVRTCSAIPCSTGPGGAWARRVAGQGGRVVVNGGNCRWGDVNWLHHLNVLDRAPERRRPVARAPSARGATGSTRREDRACLRMARVDRHHLRAEQARRWSSGWASTPSGSTVVYYGTDPEVFHPIAADGRRALRARLGWPEDRPMLAFVGALGDRRKGFDTLFAAWQIALPRPGLGRRPRGRRRRGRAPRVAGAGRRGRDRPPASASSASAATSPTSSAPATPTSCPSRYEGYSLVTQEALCCGLPAFVTAHRRHRRALPRRARTTC